MSALGAIEGVRRFHRAVKFQTVMRDVGIIAYDLQLAQTLWSDDLVLAIDEYLRAQVHLLAAFWTGVLHNC